MSALINGRPLGWIGIARLGLVQASLGAIVVLTTSTLNRVMIVELALPAALPGGLVALHYALQVLRPRFGFGSDRGGRRTPWIVGGMGLLALGGFAAAVATAWMASNPAAGIALAVLAYAAIGIGVGAAGTSTLVLLTTSIPPQRRGAAATIVWLMMIAGFVVSTIAAGRLLDPFSIRTLVLTSAVVSCAAFVLSLIAIRGLERGVGAVPRPASQEAAPRFMEALAEIWADPQALRFATFVFVSMLAYSAQELIVEPFAGEVFGLPPGATTTLSGLQHGGVLVGMIGVALLSSVIGGPRLGSLRLWTVIGCLSSAAALAGLAIGGVMGPPWPLRECVFALGIANGVYAVAAIGSMMSLTSAGPHGREGTRMGVWGASQAIAFGLGGLLGTVGRDVARQLWESAGPAYASVFAVEAILFVAAVALVARVGKPGASDATHGQAPVPYALAATARAE